MHRNMPVDLVLVRHGQSEGNLAQKLARQGRLDLWTSEFRERHNSLYRLTDMGRMQARIAGEHLRRHISPVFDKYFTSEYVRAMETAAALDLPHARWATEVYLRERDRGVLANKPHQERLQDHREEFVRKERDAFYWQPSGGESIANLCLRVDRVLESFGDNCSGLRVIVVCHGGVIKSFRALIERVRSSEYRTHDKIHNCQIVWYTRRDPKTGYISSKYNWVKSVCPWNRRLSRYTNEWREIKRHVYSNVELLRSVSQVAQLVNLPLTDNAGPESLADFARHVSCSSDEGACEYVSPRPPQYAQPKAAPPLSKLERRKAATGRSPAARGAAEPLENPLERRRATRPRAGRAHAGRTCGDTASSQSSERRNESGHDDPRGGSRAPRGARDPTVGRVERPGSDGRTRRGGDPPPRASELPPAVQQRQPWLVDVDLDSDASFSSESLDETRDCLSVPSGVTADTIPSQYAAGAEILPGARRSKRVDVQSMDSPAVAMRSRREDEDSPRPHKAAPAATPQVPPQAPLWRRARRASAAADGAAAVSSPHPPDSPPAPEGSVPAGERRRRGSGREPTDVADPRAPPARRPRGEGRAKEECSTRAHHTPQELSDSNRALPTDAVVVKAQQGEASMSDPHLRRRVLGLGQAVVLGQVVVGQAVAGKPPWHETMMQQTRIQQKLLDGAVSCGCCYYYDEEEDRRNGVESMVVHQLAQGIVLGGDAAISAYKCCGRALWRERAWDSLERARNSPEGTRDQLKGARDSFQGGRDSFEGERAPSSDGRYGVLPATRPSGARWNNGRYRAPLAVNIPPLPVPYTVSPATKRGHKTISPRPAIVRSPRCFSGRQRNDELLIEGDVPPHQGAAVADAAAVAAAIEKFAPLPAAPPDSRHLDEVGRRPVDTNESPRRPIERGERDTAAVAAPSASSAGDGPGESRCSATAGSNGSAAVESGNGGGCHARHRESEGRPMTECRRKEAGRASPSSSHVIPLSERALHHRGEPNPTAKERVEVLRGLQQATLTVADDVHKAPVSSDAPRAVQSQVERGPSDENDERCSSERAAPAASRAVAAAPRTAAPHHRVSLPGAHYAEQRKGSLTALRLHSRAEDVSPHSSFACLSPRSSVSSGAGSSSDIDPPEG